MCQAVPKHEMADLSQLLLAFPILLKLNLYVMTFFMFIVSFKPCVHF